MVMNSLSRKAFLFFTILTLLLLLAACGDSSDTSSEPTSDPETGAIEENSEANAENTDADTESEQNADGKGHEFNPDKKPITIVAPSAAGSGWDLTARSLDETLKAENLVDFPTQGVNEEGATGAVSLAQLVTEHQGSDERISVTSLPILVNYHMGLSEYDYQDVTMIARLMTEWFVIVVPEESPYQTIEELLTAIEEDPQSVPVGASGDDRLPLQLVFDRFGGDPSSINFISYEGGGEITNGLLNGDVEAALTGVSEFRSQIEAGTLRALAVTSEERLGEVFSDVPTVSEVGIDVVFGNWRGVMGPPEMPEEAVTFWEDTIEAALETETWQDIAAKNQWDITFMKGEEFLEFLEQTDQDIEEGLRKTGQIE